MNNGWDDNLRGIVAELGAAEMQQRVDALSHYQKFASLVTAYAVEMTPARMLAFVKFAQTLGPDDEIVISGDKSIERRKPYDALALIVAKEEAEKREQAETERNPSDSTVFGNGGSQQS